ncbi:cytochrome c family protein [Rhodoferax koreense]|uniref:Cytochrome c family protein n=1 Tax=Rhodoferax koreensis TaxID=1842727 RepID=A0A1P8JRB5_9BURK|nr:c-type cytochrome [Rhodoferax koreense]APW36265.1 cytochrome c family protein [Rhodoferax koreense]
MRTALHLTTAAWALLSITTAQAQDVAAGKAAFAQCAACHSIDGTNGAGPSLQGVDGRKVGSFPGFRYSRAMKATAYNWDAAKLEAYIANPQAAIPGNVMPFSGLPDAKQRADLVAYLQSLK